MAGMFGTIGDLAYKTKGSLWKPIRMDSSTHSLITISHEHTEVHHGDGYHAEYSVTTANVDGDVTGILLKTPDSVKEMHMVVTVSASDPAAAIINEAPTLADSGDGSELPLPPPVGDQDINTEFPPPE